MPDPVLVIDFGTSTSSAALVVGDDVRLLKEPATGSWSWPSAVCLDGEALLVGTLAENVKRVDPAAFRDEVKRDLGTTVPMLLGDKAFRPEELVAEVLAALRRQAEQAHGAAVERAVLTVPASYGPHDPRWAAMLTAGALAGFAEVELLAEPVAAALAPLAGPPFGPGDTVLVYDFGGGTFDTAVVRLTAAGHEVLGHAALDDCGGRDIDALLAGRILDAGGPVLADLLEPADDEPDALLDAQHVRMDLDEFVRRTKHHLTEAIAARDYLRPARRRMTTERSELTALVTPLVDRTLACCTDLLRRLDLTPKSLTAVVLVGGSSRMPAVADAVSATLRRPLRRADDLALAVVTGAAEWVRRRGPQVATPSGPTTDRRPLCWDFPGGSATLVRWLVGPDADLPANTPVAVVRLADGGLLRLATGDETGQLDATHAEPGQAVATGDWLVTVRPRPMDAGRADARHSASPSEQTGDSSGATDQWTWRILPHSVMPQEPVLDVVFVHEGAELLCVSASYAATFDVESWAERWSADHGNAVVGVASSPAGECAVVRDRRAVWVIGPGSGPIGQPFTPPMDRTTTLAIRRDGLFAVSCRSSVTTFAPGWPTASHEFDCDGRLVTAMAFADGISILAAAGDRDGRSSAVLLFDLAGGGGLLPPPSVRNRAFRDSSTMAVLESAAAADVTSLAIGVGGPDGLNALFVAGHADGSVSIWDAEGSLAHTVIHGVSVTSVAVRMNAALLVAAGADGDVTVWSVTDAAVRPLRRLTLGVRINSVALHPDGTMLAVGCEDGAARLYDLTDLV